MAAHKKTLEHLVRDRTFLARRHAELLETAPLVENANLRALQAGYRTEVSELERQALARRFEKATRSATREQELTMAQELYAGIGPGPGDVRERWIAWDKRHGFAWRIQHGAGHLGDRELAYFRLTGERELNHRRIDERMPDVMQRARDELQLKPAPDPPGIELA